MNFNENILIKSPLNYTGGKYRLLNQIFPLFPCEINTFIDLFCGGCNVGINVKYDKIICIDNEKYLIRLLNSFKKFSKEEIFITIEGIIDKYNLSKSSLYSYEYYDSSSLLGLGKYNKEKFLRLREDYNNRKEDNFYYDMMFYTIVIFSFNNQIRFNKKGDCNIPVGKRDFNDKLKKKLAIFIDRVKELDVEFILKDFRDVEFYSYVDREDVLVYADPPYLITTATYNEQEGWKEREEYALLKLLDKLNENNMKFALSNVLESKGKKNEILIDWSKKYNVHYLNFNYINSNYMKKKDNKKAKNIEVLITNY